MVSIFGSLKSDLKKVSILLLLLLRSASNQSDKGNIQKIMAFAKLANPWFTSKPEHLSDKPVMLCASRYVSNWAQTSGRSLPLIGLRVGFATLSAPGTFTR
jgi:hypothetical protein